MGINLSQVDLSNVEARAAFDAIPAGWQNAAVVNTEMKPTSDGSGQYMEIASEIVDGPYKGRKLYDRLNLVNNSATAVEIAYIRLKQLYNAVGEVRVNDSAELHGIPLKVKVKLRPARTTDDGKQYEATNEVAAYDHITSEHGAAGVGAGSSIVGGVAGAASGVPAWAAGQAAQPPAAQPPAGGPANPPAAAWQPPAGGQPWDQPGAAAAAQPPAAPGAPTSAPPAAAPPAAVQPVLTLTAAAGQGGLTLDDYRKQGWTDDLLVQHGHAQWVTPAGPAFGAPAAAAQPPAAPGAPTSAPPAAAPPAAVQPVLTLTAAAGQGGLTLDDYRKQGWTDDLLVQHGHAQWVTPAGPAFGAPAAAAQPPAAPGAPTSAPPAAAPPAAVQPVLTLTAAAGQGGLTLDDYRKQGWTDDLLVQHGHAQWVTPAGPAFGAPAAAAQPPAAPGAPQAATGAPGGTSPPWAQ